jgi:hypothetical protein
MPLRNRPARGEPVEEPDVVGLGVEDIGDSPMPLPEPAGQIGIDPIPMPEPAGVVGIDPDPAFLPSEPFQVEGEELTYVGDTTPLVPPPDREMENPWHPEDEDVQR